MATGPSHYRKFSQRCSALLVDLRLHWQEHVSIHSSMPTARLCALLVRRGYVSFKIEVSPVMRGVLAAPLISRISAIAENSFGFTEALLVSYNDLFAGKIVAALDRQHPRDLFDLMPLADVTSLETSLFEAVLVYMLCHNGSVARLLNPTMKSITHLYEHQFRGMTRTVTPIDDLVSTRHNMVSLIRGGLDQKYLDFFVSFFDCSPQWNLLECDHVSSLPAIRRRLQHLRSLSQNRRKELIEEIRRTREARFK